MLQSSLKGHGPKANFHIVPQGDGDMHGSKTFNNTFAWIAFLASYLLFWLMISVPSLRQPDIFAGSEGHGTHVLPHALAGC